jgi:glycosyltransferase involved in cell wall biosynthesis
VEGEEQLNQDTAELISVVMPTFNAAGFVRQAVESVLQQSHKNLELIAVDDGSSDGTLDILQRMASVESRLRVITKPANSGVADSLNLGFAAAKGKYLARMDADDISAPERLRLQLQYLKEHPSVALVGCWIGLITPTEGVPCAVWRYAEDHATIRAQLLFRSSIAHPSCLFRRGLWDTGLFTYDPTFERAEDYELWTRLSAHAELANVPAVLYLLRVHPSQVGQKHAGEQSEVARRVRLGQIEALGIKPTEDEMKVHEALSVRRILADRSFLDAADAWLLKLRHANSGRVHAEPEFTAVLAQRWYLACRYSTSLGGWARRRFHQSPLADAAPISRSADIRFRVAGMIRHVS